MQYCNNGIIYWLKEKARNCVLVTDLGWSRRSCALLKIVISVTLQLVGYVELFLKAFTNQICHRHLCFKEATDKTSLLSHWSPKAEASVDWERLALQVSWCLWGNPERNDWKAQVREWVWYPRMLVGHVSRGSLCRLLFDFVPASFQIVIMSLVYSESCDSDMPYGSCPVGQMIRTIL